MEKISCNIVKDLLPLYVDGILSEETMQTVAVHLETCENCQKEYQTMSQEFVMPFAPKVQEENKKTLQSLKRQIHIKKVMTAMIAAVITAIIVLSCCMIYMNVGVVREYFEQNTIVTLRDIQTDQNWQQLDVGAGYLNFDAMFCQKKVSVDINSDNAVTFRIRDINGNIVVDHLTVQPGTSASLTQLKRKTEYQVEVQTNAEFVLIHFY